MVCVCFKFVSLAHVKDTLASYLLLGVLFFIPPTGKFSQALDSLVQQRARPSNTLLIDETHFQENPNLVKMLDLQFATHKMDLLIRQNRLTEVVVEGKKVMEKFPDQWNVHNVIVDGLLRSGSVFSGAEVAASTDAKQLVFPQQDLSALLQDLYPVSDASTEIRANNNVIITPAVLTAVHQHVAYLHTLQADQPKLRGPYLAELHLLTQYTHYLQSTPERASLSNLWPAAPNSSASEISELSTGLDTSNVLHSLVLQCVSLIAAYVRRFSTKQCCFSDVKPYICATLTLETAILPVASGTSATAVLFNNLRQWGITGRAEKLTILQDAMDTATALATTKTVGATSTPVLAGGENSAVSAPAAPPAAPVVVPEEAEEEGEQDETEETAATAGATGAAAGGEGAAAAAKKKV